MPQICDQKKKDKEVAFEEDRPDIFDSFSSNNAMPMQHHITQKKKKNL